MKEEDPDGYYAYNPEDAAEYLAFCEFHQEYRSVVDFRDAYLGNDENDPLSAIGRGYVFFDKMTEETWRRLDAVSYAIDYKKILKTALKNRDVFMIGRRYYKTTK